MARKIAEQLLAGDRGRVCRGALVGDTKGNKYLTAYATIILDEKAAHEDEMYVEVSSDDRLCVSFMRGATISVVPPPEDWEEGLVWIDELRQVD